MTCFPAGAVLTKLHRYFLTPPPAIERDCSYYLGITQLMAGGGIIVIGTTLIPLLSGLF